MMRVAVSADDTERGLPPAGQRETDHSGSCGGDMMRGAAGTGRKPG